MTRAYRINQKIIDGGQVSTFDIVLESNNIKKFIENLEGKITVWEKIIDNDGEYEENLPMSGIKKISIKYKEGYAQIKAYKGKIYFKKDLNLNQIASIVFENVKTFLPMTVIKVDVISS